MTQLLDDRTLAVIRRILATLSLMVGLAALVFGTYWIKRRHDFLATAATAQGRVIANRRVEWTSRGSGGGMGTSRHAYRAIVMFTDRAGHHLTHPDFLAMNPSSFSVGQTVTILYDPNAPSTAWVDRGNKELYLLLGISALGTLLLLSGVRALSNARLKS